MHKQALIFSTAYFPMVGGAEVAMKEITDRLSDWDLHVWCARIRPGLASTERWENVTIRRVGFGFPVDKYLLPFLAAPLAAWKFRSTKPVVWALLASYGGFSALVYTWLRPSSKMLLTLQEGDPLEHYDKRTGFLGFLHRAIFVRANEVQAISKFLANWAKRMGFAGDPHIIPNGVDISRFTKTISAERRYQIRQEFGVTEQDIVIVTASRLSLKNAVDDIIRALTFLPEKYKVLIAGEGEDKKMLESLAANLGVSSRVVFLGRRSHDELPGILMSADMFCRPSLSEGLGNSFLEAMSAGLPIIGTPVGGIPDFLIDGETGVFCEPRSPESLAKAVLRITEEPGLREKLSRQGKQKVEKEYNWEQIVKDIREIIKKLDA
ncbi:glycosyltransferase family 4 protein [Candidatus Uhrbacteria bacterium]|nr:glycosyltransferase family 4 protein [Candidatus Uhrbacteria bacterium]